MHFSSGALSRFLYNDETPSQNVENSGYSKEINELHEDTKERLKALGTNVEGGWADLIDKSCDVAFEKFFEQYQSTDFSKPEEIDKLNKFMRHTEVQKLATEKLGKDVGADMMFRTEMVARVNHFLKEQVSMRKVTAEQASDLLLGGMEQMKQKDKSANNSLRQASRMINYGKKENLLGETIREQFRGNKRKELAEKMEKGEQGVHIEKGKITLGGKTYDIKNCEILTGVAMAEIDIRFLEKFVLKNAIFAEDGKILAQMQNGCEGNLVVLNVTEKEEVVEQTPPPEVVPEEIPVVCEDCEIDKKISLKDITPEQFKNWLDNASEWEERGIKRSEMADAIYNYFLMDTPLGKISRKKGLVNVILGDRNSESIASEEYLARYKKYLSLDAEDQEKLLETFTGEEIQKQEQSLQEMHADAIANNGVLSEKYRAAIEAQMGAPISDDEFRNFGERLASFTWETMKQSFMASLAASAVATLAAGNPVGVAVVFVEFFRSTIGAKTKLEMVSVRKMDLVAEHARLHKKFQDRLDEAKGNGENLLLTAVSLQKQEFYEFRLFQALDHEIKRKPTEQLSPEDAAVIDAYLKKASSNAAYAENLYQTAYSSKETVRNNTDDVAENDEKINITDPVRQAIERRRLTYEKYRKEVGDRLFDAVEGQVDAQDLVSKVVQRIGEFLGMGDRADTPEEAYEEINEWILEYEEGSDYLEIRDGKLQFKNEFIKEMTELKKGDPEEYDDRMRELDQENKKYTIALQLRAQLFNAAKLSLPREGGVVFTQSADLLDRLNTQVEREAGTRKAKQETLTTEGEKAKVEKGIYTNLKPSVDKYLNVVTRIYEALDPVMELGSGFSLEELELDGDAHLSYVLGRIRSNVEALNKALQDGDKVKLVQIIGNINQATEWQSGNNSTYESVNYLENVVLPALERRKPEVVQVPDWMQRVREDEYKKESPHTLKVCEMAPEDYIVIPYTDESTGMPIGWSFEVARTDKMQTKSVTEKQERTKTETVQTGETFNPNKEFITKFNDDPSKWTQDEIQKYMDGTLDQYLAGLSPDAAREVLGRLGIDPGKFITPVYEDVTTKWIETVSREATEKIGGWTADKLKTSIPGIFGGMTWSQIENRIWDGKEKDFGTPKNVKEVLQKGNEVKSIKKIEKAKIRFYGQDPFEANLLEVTFTHNGKEHTAKYLSKDGKLLFVEEKQWSDDDKELIIRDESTSLEIKNGKIEVKRNEK